MVGPYLGVRSNSKTEAGKTLLMGNWRFGLELSGSQREKGICSPPPPCIEITDRDRRSRQVELFLMLRSIGSVSRGLHKRTL